MRAKLENGQLRFDCPGCPQGWHQIPVDGSRGWAWNRSTDRPTITPSINAWADGYGHPDGTVEGHWRCHSYVTDGRIQFLSDSTHALAGQTVDLPEIQS